MLGMKFLRLLLLLLVVECVQPAVSVLAPQALYLLSEGEQ